LYLGSGFAPKDAGDYGRDDCEDDSRRQVQAHVQSQFTKRSDDFHILIAIEPQARDSQVRKMDGAKSASAKSIQIARAPEASPVTPDKPAMTMQQQRRIIIVREGHSEGF
jgi:hypothetical protein